MKIAYDYEIFTMQRYGGISRYFVKLAEHLGHLEQETKIFAPLHQNKYLASVPKPFVSGRSVNEFPRKTGRVIKYANSIIANRQIINWKPDILHQTYFSGSKFREKKCPVVITVHDMIDELFPDFMGINTKTSRDKKIAIKNADHIICISENTKRDVIELLNICESKISVVHHGVDTPNISTTILHTSLASSDQPYILYVGARGGYKNFKGLLKAVAQSPKLKNDFRIIAFGGGALSRHEREEVENCGLDDCQVLHVSGDDSLLKTYYENASVFCYPSLYEGFGMPPLEAMSAGCPVVSSNTSSMPEVISDAAEFFNPEDIECFAQAIEAVVYSAERRADLVARGYMRVHALSWNKCAQQTLNVYEKLR